MRFSINLATHPHQNARQFYLRWGAAIAALFILTCVLAGVAWQEWSSTRTVNLQIEKTRSEIARLEKQKQEQTDILNRQENQGTRDRAEFVNQLLARRAFSWTQVFTELESIMPTRVHITSINPAVNEQNQLTMKITADSDSRDKLIELVHNLEKSRHFRQPLVTVEKTAAQVQNPQDAVEFGIIAFYVPDYDSAPSQNKGGN